jgi:serine/threonine-protein kinase
LFHSALELDLSERGAFLDQMCGEDDALRREVESLLAADAEALGVSEALPAKVAVKMLAEDQDSQVEEWKLGHYRIVSKLGAGGMGEVYLAQSTKLGRKVAIKLLSPQFTGDLERLRRFEWEARAASKLNHPHIATIYDICEEGGAHFIVMEYVEGQTLAAILNDRGLDSSEVIEIGLQIADALEEAHSKGITHRDVKPANLMLTPRGQVKVLDFGLAKIAHPAEMNDDYQHITRMQTMPGMVMGTVAYMSPEQALGREVDRRTDIFSLGVVFYEMTTGRRPFGGETATETIDNILHAQPEAITRLNYRMPAELERIIGKCLEKDRDRRYQSAQELMSDLKRLQQQSLLSQPTVADIHSKPVEEDGQQKVPRTGRQRVQILFAIVALALVTAICLWVFRQNIFGPQSEIKSLAVLPLANLTNNPGEEYLADSMTDELISNLMGIGALRVISRTSVMRYKATEQSAGEIAKELRVDALVEGSVRTAGERVLINVRMIHAATEQQLWVKRYERDRSDLLALQSQVAQDIASEIRIKVTPQEQARLARVPSVDPEALQLYFKGRYLWGQRGEGLKKGVDYFQQAISKDPNFAMAHAGLADSYILLGDLSQAKETATTALKLDDTLAEAQTSLAAVKLLYEWDWPAAESGFKRAIDLKPGYATAHHWYAEYLTAMGRHEDALSEIKRAQELDPHSLVISKDVGRHYYFARQYDRAIAQFKNALDLDSNSPNSTGAHTFLGLTYVKKAMPGEAFVHFNKAIALSRSSNNMAMLGYAYASAGRRNEAEQVLDTLIQLSTREQVSPYWIAVIFGAMGDREQAFAWLQKAHDQRSSPMVYLKVHPTLDGLRSDPRFRDLMRRVRIPD